MKKIESRTYEVSGYPQVYKDKKTGQLVIIYRDHIEFYKFQKEYYTCDEQKYDPIVEEDMVKGAGFKQVHASRKHEMIFTEA